MEAYIFDAIRTPRGSARKNGSLRSIKPINLISLLLNEIVLRNDFDAKTIDDIILGCVTQTKEQGANIARVAALHAGLHHSVGGMTVNRFCTSGLDAISIATQKIATKTDHLIIAGGIESVSRVPMFSDKGAWFTDREVMQTTQFVHMGVAADIMASLYSISRRDVDLYSIESHRRASRATREGYFNKSLIPVYAQDGSLLLTQDECFLEHVNDKTFSSIEPSFKGGETDKNVLSSIPSLTEVTPTHHWGSSPALADGASVILIGSKEKGEELGLHPRAKIRTTATTSVHPLLLTGGQNALAKALDNTNLTAKDIDIFEYNEAFGATVLHFINDYNLDHERVNRNGGVISMGHALGATGGMLLATLLDEMERVDYELGAVGISGGAGVGSAIIIERV
ncbi:acetyl-CoA C-acyltransferase [Cytobacillus sp. IB215665]|uniref:acetyl-CoA C-acyltransferase n=1 Tax=Cytobacillus sp. IB215665 TaxID=3097357 RepID=UPI002A14CC39|nr:acetyl-CoA C-acyltransferase [Cytobacillus sp. IB215665]MDX8365710.1 acetyl-CoA C-acyltransferase [Cytobacillus sp. IB215665]